MNNSLTRPPEALYDGSSHLSFLTSVSPSKNRIVTKNRMRYVLPSPVYRLQIRVTVRGLRVRELSELRVSQVEEFRAALG